MLRSTTTTLPRRPTRVRWLGVMCAGALALGVYGFGTTSAVAKTSKRTVVKTATVSGVGTILVSTSGRALYTLTNNGQAVDCTGSCLAVWPPLLVKSGTKPKGAKGVTGLAVSGRQVTQNSMPLYLFSGDTKSDQANGEGINSFGGVWHVVKASSSGGSPTPTTAAKSSSSSGGYGY
jgi:predicted lipoprotein with Yx(FWY)xxD motif